MKNEKITPLKAIRLKCLDCCCDKANEVKLCTAKKCPLYNFRFGKSGNTRQLTDEQKAAFVERVRKKRHIVNDTEK